MSHFAARSRFSLSIEVKMRAGFARNCQPVVGSAPDQVFHFDLVPAHGG
jgi:hypothetical protein